MLFVVEPIAPGSIVRCHVFVQFNTDQTIWEAEIQLKYGIVGRPLAALGRNQGFNDLVAVAFVEI